MGLFKSYRDAKKLKNSLIMPEDGEEVKYFQEQSKRLAVIKNIQDILTEYYDKGNCEMIPIKAPLWTIPIVTEVLDKEGIRYIVREDIEEIDIIDG